MAPLAYLQTLQGARAYPGAHQLEYFETGGFHHTADLAVPAFCQNDLEPGILASVFQPAH